ncbi:MAG: ribonuclease H-like domain-containing protein [Candidatus Hodarchaeota archaeon]
MEAKQSISATNINIISASLRRRVRQQDRENLQQDANTGVIGQALNLQRRLLRQHQGHSLEDIFPGRIISTPSGKAFEIHCQEPILFRKTDLTNALSLLYRTLPVLSGIRKKTAQKLASQGFHSLQDLTRHSRWRNSAKEILDLIENKQMEALLEHFSHRFGRSHSNLLAILEAFCSNDAIRILDVETLGFHPSPLFLIGIAKPSSQGLEIRQLLARNLDEEPALLEACFRELSSSRVLISFNGRSFDMPYLHGRAGYYGLPQPSLNVHFDLLHFSRRYWENKVSNCKLGTLEQEILRIDRKMSLPSALVPRFYQSYLKTQNPGPLVPIIAHNKQDLVSLAAIFNQMCRN